MRSHELAHILLEMEDKPVAVSVDISTGEDDAHLRVFGDVEELNDKHSHEAMLLCSGCLNEDRQEKYWSVALLYQKHEGNKTYNYPVSVILDYDEDDDKYSIEAKAKRWIGKKQDSFKDVQGYNVAVCNYWEITITHKADE